MKENTYAIIGSGRLALHFSHYLKLLNIPTFNWSRDNSTNFNSYPEITEPTARLTQSLKSVSHVLLLISDDAIVPFINEHPELKSKTLIHCSGSLNTKLAHGIHPLMSFSHKLYDLEFYKNIHFVCDSNSDFKSLFPKFNNPYSPIDLAQKELYHAICVISGNFPQFLWNECLKTMKSQLNLPDNILDQYINKISQNFIELKSDSLTGPFVRKDQGTLNKNLKALEGSPLEDIYQSFINNFKSQNKNNHAINFNTQKELR